MDAQMDDKCKIWELHSIWALGIDPGAQEQILG